MTEKIGIGIQEFDEIRDGKCFYIDKTYFIGGRAKIRQRLLPVRDDLGKLLI